MLDNLFYPFRLATLGFAVVEPFYKHGKEGSLVIHELSKLSTTENPNLFPFACYSDFQHSLFLFRPSLVMGAINKP